MTIKDYEELDVYQSAMDSAMRIFSATRSWPREERYVLTAQILRPSRSICSNMAEAWRKRRYPAAFVSKLSDADGESGETMVWLTFALKCGYMAKTESDELRNRYRIICSQLVVMMKDAKRWCGQDFPA